MGLDFDLPTDSIYKAVSMNMLPSSMLSCWQLTPFEEADTEELFFHVLFSHGMTQGES